MVTRAQIHEIVDEVDEIMMDEKESIGNDVDVISTDELSSINKAIQRNQPHQGNINDLRPDEKP